MEKKTLTEAAPRRIAAAAAASAVGIGKKWRRVFRRAEMSVQFYLPFFIQSFLSLIRRTAGYILSRRKPCCLMTKNEREIDVVFTTTIQPASPLHNTHWSGIENSNLKYICSNMSELKEKWFFNPKLLCWCSDLGKSTKSVRTVWKTTQMPSYVNLPNLNLIINIQVISTNWKKKLWHCLKYSILWQGDIHKLQVHCALCSLSHIRLFIFELWSMWNHHCTACFLACLSAWRLYYALLQDHTRALRPENLQSTS